MLKLAWPLLKIGASKLCHSPAKKCYSHKNLTRELDRVSLQARGEVGSNLTRSVESNFGRLPK